MTQHAPPPPPPPPGGPKGGGGGGKPRPSRMDRQKATQTALGNVRNAFMEAGHTPQDALRLAHILLTRPNVQIAKGGVIRYNGRVFSPQAFTTSGLAKFVTGQRAANLNTQAIEGDPGYTQALAQLALNRDTAQSGIGDTRRQQLIQFGDPSLVQGDANTAGAAAVNPFSTVGLLGLQNQRNQAAATQAAAKYGTVNGGGLQSGLGEAQRVYAGNMQDAYTKLQSLLATLNEQQAANDATYGLGQKNAQLNTYNTLLASGAIHAAHAPNLSPGAYHYWRGLGGGGGAKPGRPPIIGRPPPPIPIGNPPPYSGPNPPMLPNPGLPNRTLDPTGVGPTQLPNMQSFLSRYGLTGSGM